MAKRTRKYLAALQVLGQKWRPACIHDDQEYIYGYLRERGLQWDSKSGVWVDLADEPADEPSALVRVRVWADGEIIDEVADEVVGAMGRRGWRAVERSMPYTCRPPKQLESRVYLTLEPPRRG